jgi:hypothetical protein
MNTTLLFILAWLIIGLIYAVWIGRRFKAMNREVED